MAGLLVILVGVLFLLRNLGLIPYISWDIVWPLVVILVGVAMLERHIWWRHRWSKWNEYGNWKRNARKSDDIDQE